MQKLFSMGKKVVDWVLPPQCLKCLEIVDCQGALCSSCWGSLSFITSPYCKQCGMPFEVQALAEMLCGGCLQKEPAFDRCRTSLCYDDGSRELLLRFKHGDGTLMAPHFAEWILRVGREILESADLLVPVPLHWSRLMFRQYNQAALLGQALSEMTSVPFLSPVLKRRRYTASQGKKRFKDRARNVRGAFSLRQKYVKMVKNRRIVLIDDVVTSGATVSECARILRRGGACNVDVLAVAQTVL